MATDGGTGRADSAPAEAFRVSAPPISLPKGGGAIRGIGEKFAADPVTGTGSLTLPIFASPGRGGFGPQLSLSYNSGAGNGPFGLGWNLSLPSITRKTDKGLPRYGDAGVDDTFILSGAEDLAPALAASGGGWNVVERDRTLYGRQYRVRRYRPRIEGLFARLERWSSKTDAGDVFWRSISKDNVVAWYGTSPENRIADPGDPARIFSWLLAKTHDDKGNLALYRYAAENSDGVDPAWPQERNRTAALRSANRYLIRILYGNRAPYFPVYGPDPATPEPSDWCFELVFDYGDHDALAPLPYEPGHSWWRRDDPFSSYRAAFEVRTYRLCRRALMFHHFPTETDVGADCLVRSTDFTYSSDIDHADPRNPIYSLLVAAGQTGFRRKAGGGYVSKSLPPLTFAYTEPAIDETIHEAERASLDNLPQGLDGGRYQWADLDGEGLSGILTEQAGAWIYKRNVSPRGAPNQPAAQPPAAHLASGDVVRRKPSLGALGGGQQLLDLAGDGMLDLVQFGAPTPGFFERTDDADWGDFRTFNALPALSWDNPNLKFVDLTGDGHADILISEDEVLVWHESLGEAGFGAASRIRQALDEEKGPRIVFADGSETISLADFSGDGLADIVRIRNGEICYWPNLGYGRFGAKVTMDNAPLFEAPDLFDGRRIRQADIDGSGATDLIYFSNRGTQIYFNQSGNSWSAMRLLAQFPPVDSAASAMVVDLLGNGTACLVWSSSLPGARSLRYIDLMGGAKPHLLVGIDNNLGAETRIEYAPSTRFYLDDEAAGRPWITRLPFPVHVVARVETYDYVSRNRFVSRHAYHHGYFDGVEREFRGFGMVERWDTEEFAALSVSDALPSAANVDAASHAPPVLTRTWYHTGVYLGRQRVSNFFAGLLRAGDEGEYYRAPGVDDAAAGALLLDDTVLPAGWSVEDEREACRALKGSMLRQEIYALDGSAKQPHPYSVVEQNFTLERLQPAQGSAHGVFFAHPREALTYHYERDPAKPRIEHALTLEVDGYGNVLRTLAVAYGRGERDPALEPADQDRQAATLITYTQSGHTVAADDVALWPDAYRAPLPCDVQTYEVTGFAPAGRFAFDDWAANNFSRLAQLGEIAYDATADPTQTQKRLIERVRTRFRADDLSALLAQGDLQPRALAGERHKLAFTLALLTNVFRRQIGSGPVEALIADPAQVLLGGGGDHGGYVDLDNDGHFYVPSGQAYFHLNPDGSVATPAAELTQAKARFFQPQEFVDPFGAVTSVRFDSYDLLPHSTTDALGNMAVAAHDYRVLQPWQLTDPNGNRTQAAFDRLGLVAGTAVLGKVSESLGDDITGFIADPDQTALDTFFAAADPQGAAQTLLGDATTRILYDIDRFRSTRDANPGDPSRWQPVYAATLSRERHVSDLQVGEQSDIQISVSYSDGLGHEIQKKIQAEPGALQTGGPVVSPRWVGSGWTILNNKAKPVRQYEPYFSATHHFEFAATAGVSPILFYDPIGRVVATLLPDHSWEKVVFDAWRQENWDASDTLLIGDPALPASTRPGDPSFDIDVGGYFKRLPPADYLKSWYDQRIDGSLGAAAKTAAEKTAVHAGTPTKMHFDSMGRAFLSIAHNRFNTGDPLDPVHEEFYPTRTLLDIEGNQREVIDAKGRVVARNDYDVLSRRLHSISMEAGERWMLNDIVSNPLQSWNSRNHRLRSTYDALRRATDTYLFEGSGPEILVGRYVYGETRPNPALANLLGRVVQVLDQAGAAQSDLYDFKGNLLRSQRQLAQNYKTTLDWSAGVALEAQTYASTLRFDALNRPVQMTQPDDSVIRPGYNEASLLTRLDVNLRGARQSGQPVWTSFVTSIGYDAKGQRQAIAYANGTVTDYTYDADTFRLTRLSTTRAADSADLQDLSYTYDPVGDVMAIADQAQQTIYFNNQVVTASATFEYDALHRLIAATGREHLGQAGSQLNALAQPNHDDSIRAGRPHPCDGNAVGNYTERYAYDAVGNILNLIHTASSGAWTRRYDYEPGNNRLRSTSLPGDAAAPYSARYDHDAHGNMTQMPHLAQMLWDFKDNLAEVDLTGGGRAYFVYDTSGQRVRKVWEKSSSLIEERIYLGAFEIFRRHNASSVTLERQTLHVLDGHNRIAMVETKTVDSGAPVPSPAGIVRYQYANHLGSAALELDDAGAVISYEEYFPYGGTSLQTVSGAVEVSLKRYRYQAKERDEETGLDYFGARYYAAWLGRWTGADPAGHVDGLNLYQFVRCNPLILTDPSGTQSAPPDGGPQLSGRDTVLIIAGAQENFAKMQAAHPTWIVDNIAIASVADKDGVRTVTISYDTYKPVKPSKNLKPVDGPLRLSVGPHYRQEHSQMEVSYSTPSEEAAPSEDPAASQEDTVSTSSGSVEAESPKGSSPEHKSSEPGHQSSSIVEFLEKAKKFLETASEIKSLIDPTLDYLKERFSKLGEKLAKIGEAPWIKKSLGFAKGLLEHGGKVLTGIISIIEGVESGSSKPVSEGVGEIIGNIVAEAIVEVVVAVALVVLAIVDAGPIAVAVVLTGIALVGIWLGDKLGSLFSWLGGKIDDGVKAGSKTLKGFFSDIKYKAMKGITDFNNWNPGLAH